MPVDSMDFPTVPNVATESCIAMQLNTLIIKLPFHHNKINVRIKMQIPAFGRFPRLIQFRFRMVTVATGILKRISKCHWWENRTYKAGWVIWHGETEVTGNISDSHHVRENAMFRFEVWGNNFRVNVWERLKQSQWECSLCLYGKVMCTYQWGQ